MPSGAKKRKAAKKKKEQQSINNSNNSSSVDNSSPRGNDDPKSQDERESDGGEVGSPASREHNSEQHSFNEENEESEKTDSSSFASECKPVEGVAKDAEGSQKVGVEDDTVVTTERELNREQYMESKEVSVEHVESAKESHDGDDKSSSNSSSDDESRVFDMKWKEEAHNSASGNMEKVFPEEETQVLEIEKSIKEATGNSVADTAHTVVLVTPVVPLSDVAKHVMEGVEVENSEVLCVVEPGLKENEDKLLLESSDVVSSLVPKKNKDSFFSLLDENVGPSTNVVSSTVNGNENKVLTSPGAHSSETSIYAENVNDLGTLNGTVIGNEAKTLTSSGTCTSETSNETNNTKDTRISEYTETQPLVPPAAQVSQRTSWTSCCGLFDVFTGSNR
ncbi:hypothetical protein P3X46_026700 [Hevea brasiliensis]|uniref:Uncharacterized protein n=1 Tax=Hevea brasiliensis TaxID=3981 RepID=A0ABQ9KZR1_HEVBR|nr:uncharacterized protein LOC110644751 [Hevea brasiliensis]KAJ9153236.1 hypothetical protein P3X46_026700 [Hevea brasiliensis]